MYCCLLIITLNDTVVQELIFFEGLFMETKYISMVAAAVFALVCLVGYIMYEHADKRADSINLTEYEAEEITYIEEASEPTTIIVYITGEIAEPDVYEMPADARLVDLVEKAGGFTAYADKDALNLAAHLADGEKIVVGNINDKVDKTEDLEENINKDESIPVNINTADAAELETLEDIGPSLAENIIEYRNRYGSFTSIEEIREVDGIGEATFNKIKDSITIN